MLDFFEKFMMWVCVALAATGGLICFYVVVFLLWFGVSLALSGIEQTAHEKYLTEDAHYCPGEE